MSSPTLLFTVSGGAEYALAPNTAVLLMADGSARILDMNDGFYAISAIGALMLQRTLWHGLVAAAEQVADECGIEQARAEADLRQFLTTLEQRGIIQRRGPKAAQNAPSSRAARYSASLLKLVIRLLPWRKARAAVLLTAARISLRLFGWTGTIHAWKKRFSQRERVLPRAEADALAEAIADATCDAAAWNPLGVACKERALCCWALARLAGLPAELVIGVELFPLSGHCWCQVGARILSDHPDNCARYVPALCYA